MSVGSHDVLVQLCDIDTASKEEVARIINQILDQICEERSHIVRQSRIGELDKYAEMSRVFSRMLQYLVGEPHESTDRWHGSFEDDPSDDC